MENKTEIRLVGSGGQGVILGSIILADAALRGGRFSVQSQSYGPEARGGTCKAEAIISDTPIDFPKVEHNDFLLALTQSALEKYIKNTHEKSVIMIDASMQAPSEKYLGKIVRVPILKTANEVLKKPMTANIVAVGAINAYMHLVDDKALEEAVLARVPKGTEELNRAALEEGRKIVANNLEEI